MADSLIKGTTFGVCSYSLGPGPDQTFTFNDSTYTESFTVTPHYDKSGRTVTYSTFSIVLTTYINNAPSVDSDVSTAIAILNAPGGVFQYVGRGCGNLQVNLLGTRDVNWGCKPKVLSLKPWGGAQTTQLTWTIEIDVPTCDDAVFAFAMMEFCYSVKWAIDYAGFTTRTVSGFLRIPQTRKTPTTRTLSDSADNYREKIAPDLVLGFKRNQSFTLDYSKCRLDFNIVDTQLDSPNAYPDGIIEASADHSYTTTNTPAGSIWVFTLNAEYEMLQGFNAIQATAAFQNLLADRTAECRRMIAGAGLPGIKPDPGKTIFLIPWHFSVSLPSTGDEWRSSRHPT